MDDPVLLERIQELTDLELAVLLSLVAQQHCLIETPDNILDDVAAELSLIASEVFELKFIVLGRDDLQSVDKFVEVILDEDLEERSESNATDSDYDISSNLHAKVSGISFGRKSSSVITQQKLDSRKVVNVVIAKDFNFASEDVQIQALELIRKGRIYSRTTVHTAPKVFLFLPLVTSSSKHIRLTKHLNDRIFISHFHDPRDGFSNLEELDIHSEDQISSYSIGHSSSVRKEELHVFHRIDEKTIELLRSQGKAVVVTPEIRRYLQDIVVFLRIERGVDGGVSPYATTLLLSLAKYLAPFHGINYVTPSLVALATKKIYQHRIVMASPSRERSTQYGTDMASARELLRDLDPEKVIQNVLDTVECPT